MALFNDNPMSTRDLRRSPEQAEHERTLDVALEYALAEIYERPEHLRIMLDLAETHDEYLVAIDENGQLLRWFGLDYHLRRQSPERVMDQDRGSTDTVARHLLLRELEEWVIDHAEQLAWIHPRFRWCVCEAHRRN